MGYRHTKEEILDAALAAASEDGLSQLTFGRVAKRIGISDRTVVYYFPTKEDLVGEVLIALATRLQETLAPAFASPATDHIELLRNAWPILASTDADPVFALFFEAAGLAAAKREPYLLAGATGHRSMDRVGRDVRGGSGSAPTHRGRNGGCDRRRITAAPSGRRTASRRPRRVPARNSLNGPCSTRGRRVTAARWALYRSYAISSIPFPLGSQQ